MRRNVRILSAMLFCVSACQLIGKGARMPQTGAPTFSELNEATYSGASDTGSPITLQNGSWEGPPVDAEGGSRTVISLAQGYMVTGDLDGDGIEEAVVLLSQANGDSGTFDSLAVMKRMPQGIQNLDTAALGDRVQIRAVRIEPGRLSADIVRAGPDDASCCPGELATMSWPFSAGRLSSVETTVTGRLSLDVLWQQEWVLRTWDNVEDVPREPIVTLEYAEGRIAGRSGCNRYTTAATLGDTPGTLTMAPIAGTRMACAEPAASIERRFLQQLGAADRFGFFLGQLFIAYKKEAGTAGVMRFDGRPALPPQQ